MQAGDQIAFAKEFLPKYPTPPSLSQAISLARHATILDLKSKVRLYCEAQAPPDVEKLLEIKTVATQKQISELKFFIRARDILCFWKAMARAIRIDVDFDFSSCKQVIQQSKEFPNWMEEHRDQLNQITSLRLNNLALTLLPKEIGMLKNLTYLDLSMNLLTSCRKEIGTLKNLDYCDLSWNKLVSLPKEMLDLKQSQRLSLYGNPLYE